ncbi:MAG: D-tyrosyl-tRNA(Tyr) deacylase [Deltaproteobacteria bacterium]|nr:D-tyrosyl-tRNA(Tyr) deacylase [Deltaproteobacteria bacterium]
MRAVVQRVKRAQVAVGGENVGSIERGLLVLLGVGSQDTASDLEWMVEKVTGLRIFEDVHGKMNLSVVDVGGELLVVSQFTLFGDCRRGKRPSFTAAMEPDRASKMIDDFVRIARGAVKKVDTGVFGATMEVELVNEGPVTILLDSEKKF